MSVRSGIIVVADDEALQRETLANFLRGAGHEVLEATNGAEAVAHVEDASVDLVLTDYRMPDLSGQAVLERVRAIQPEVAVVMVTAYGTVTTAVEAMKAGAVDFLTKPVDLDELERLITRTLERVHLIRENRELRQQLVEARGRVRLLGRAPALDAVLARGARAAETDATILILGETGTGKELLARTIHDLSGRAEGPFVAVNCAALPETLLESELFGHEKGAFTGAQAQHRGRVELAEGGTLFLDEIGDISPAVQVKLLRFLQEREYSRVGGERTLHADVRVIGATHRDLLERIQSGHFREDLYYRLNVVSLRLPPLRERREDIPELVEHFLTRYAKRYGRPVRSLTREALDALIKHDFAGNVRELENLIEQAVVLSAGETIALDDLPEHLGARLRDRARARADARRGSPAPTSARAADLLDLQSGQPPNGGLPGLLQEVEKRAILAALDRFDNNQSQAARHLGLTESGLRYKMSRWKSSEA